MCLFGMINFPNLFYYSSYFYYYSWVLLHFLVLFMELTIKFQLIFTFIYSIFNKISESQTEPKYLTFVAAQKSNSTIVCP